MKAKESKLRNTVKNIKMIILPTHIHGTLGMCQRTIAVSIWIVFVLLVLSIILESINNNGWIGMLENYCIGIACSTLVVIVTVVIQFKNEQFRAVRDYNDFLLQILCLVQKTLKRVNNKNLKISPNEIQRRYEDLFQMLSDYIDIAPTLYWYDHNIYNDHMRLYLELTMIYVKLTHDDRNQSKEQLLKSISPKKMKEIYKRAQRYGEHFKVKDINLFNELLE